MEQNYWDRVVGYFSPQTAYKRMQYRAAMGIAEKRLEIISKRGYEGAGGGRRWKGFYSNSDSGEQSASIASQRLRSRFRELVRNNGYAAQSVRQIVSEIVGYGIIGKPEDPTLADMWKEFCENKELDVRGQMGFYSMQALAARTTVESGAVIALRQRISRAEQRRLGLPVPFQIKLIEPDHIAHEEYNVFKDGQKVTKGVEISENGRPTALYLYKYHPGDTVYLTNVKREAVRIGMEDLIYHYDVLRPGQVHGIPWGFPVMLKLRDFDDYEDAQLVRQKIAACFTGFIHDNQEVPNETIGKDEEQKPMSERFEPGSWEVLPPGKSITLTDPPGVGTDYDPYTRRTLKGIASGIGIPYEILAQDYSDINFSAGKLSRTSFNKLIHHWRWNMFIPNFCKPVWNMFLEGLRVQGIPTPNTKIIWTPPGIDFIDPDREVQSIIRQVRSGLKPLSEAIRELGYDSVEHFKQIASDIKTLDDLQLVLDSDPRRTTQAGIKQSEGTGTGISTEED